MLAHPPSHLLQKKWETENGLKFEFQFIEKALTVHFNYKIVMPLDFTFWTKIYIPVETLKAGLYGSKHLKMVGI